MNTRGFLVIGEDPLTFSSQYQHSLDAIENTEGNEAVRGDFS